MDNILDRIKLPEIPKGVLKIAYSEWYINIKNPPKENDHDYDIFWEKQERLCKEGCVTGGVFFNPYLYWHLNFWKTEVDYLDDNDKPQQSYINPNFRDNEWMTFNSIWEAERQQKGLAIGGIRRYSKSVQEASYIAHGATFDQDSQNIIAGLNSADIKLITDKIDKGLNNLPEYFQWERVESDWKKAVTLGVQSKNRKKYVFSQILIRNLDNGNNEEAIAGTKPRKLIIDEALDENELVYTKDGSKTIRDISIGEYIYDDQGKLTKILEKVSPGIVPSYKVTLSDGREVVASGNHIWKVWNTYLKRETEITTGEMSKRYYFSKRDNRYDKTVKSYIYSVPQNKCLEFEEKELPVDPYYLGCWLGDGMSGTVNHICNMDKEVIDFVKEYADRLGLEYLERFAPKEGKHPDFRYMRISNGKGKVNPLIESMKSLGLQHNKHIPKLYLNSSKEQRLELLRGLFDTDGSIFKNGTIKFNSSIPTLAQSVVELCRSLGMGVKYHIKPTYYLKNNIKHKCKDTCVVYIKTTEDIFKIQRKRDNYRKDKGSRNDLKSRHNFNYVTITNIEPVGERKCYCVRVDNESKLFLTTNYVVTHNCAKEKFIRSLQAAIPGFSTPYGWTCSPICTFTGGDAKTFADAQELMMNPNAYNFLAFPHKEKENVVHGFFADATYRLEGKEWSTFAEYIGQPENKELQKIKMQVSNPEKALKVTEDIIEQRRLAGDTEAYLKERMYYPINVEDVFLTSSTNFFNKEAIKKQIQFIQDKGIKGNYIELYHDGTGIKSRASDKKPISQFPTPKGANLDAPIVMWEPPVSDNKFALYVAGHDSYQKDGQTIHSDSLGALYIYKRIYSLSGDGFQDMLVASLVARPKDKSYFNEQCRLLIKYYNAYTLAENNELSFIDYMKGKNDAVKYLAPQPAWLKAVTPFSTQNQSFGVSRSSDKVQSFLEELTSNYIDEVIHKNLDQDGSVINEVIGVSRIYDIPLLQELLTYERGKNADRYVAFSLALAQANDLNPVLNPEKKKDKNSMVEAIINNAKNSRTFGKNPNKFTQKRRR